ncbi:MAG: Mammalian cell entry related domain protein, partial [Solirubrobacterales bacterium]|nr:Mammalian cell entry related domain protein [Solirubrobacterales bacterium]
MSAPRRRRRRARTNAVPVRRVLIRGGLVTGLLVLFTYLATSLYSGIPGRDYRTVSATLPQVGNLIQHDPVRLAGVRIGQVQSVEAGSDGKAHLKLQLNPGLDVPVDSRIVIRANGLLGARFVQIVPGTSTDTVAEGGTIRPAATQSLTYGVPEALDTFDKQTRGRLQDMVTGLGTGIAGRGDDLNLFFRRVSDEVVHAQELFTTVSATRAVPYLLPSMNAALEPLNANRTNLLASMPQTTRALQPLIGERGAVRSTLDVAPGALDAADGGLTKGTVLLASVRQVADAARRTLPYALAGLRQTSRLLNEAKTPLGRTEDLLREARPTVPKVLEVTRALRPVLT